VFQNPIYLPQRTNRESWTLTVGLYDDDTGDPIALTDSSGNPTVSFQFEVRRSGPGGQGWAFGDGYGPYAGLGSYDVFQPILTASLGNGITIIDTGVIQVYFSETAMRALGPATWDVGCTMASLDGIDVNQLFRARLPILRGFVTT
jgi:hypothetical protein